MTRTIAGRIFATFVLASSLTACHASSSSPSGNSTTPAASAKLAVDQPSYSFPTTPVGQTALSTTIQLSATGTGSLVVANVSSSNPAEFAVTDVTNCISATLVGGGPSCQISIRFQPTTPGVRTSKVVAATSDGGSVTIDAIGNATASGSSGTAGGGSGGDGGGGSGGGGSGGGGSGGGTASGAGSFPQAPCVPNGTSTTTVTVVNTTSALIQLSLTGPITSVVSLPPGDIQQVPVLPGNYTITGSASVSNAGFIPSTWSMVSGCDYLAHVVQVSSTQMALRR
jgi:hypothetical protein